MSYPLKNMGFPTFPPFNFVHAGTMYQNKMFSKDRKNGHMLFDYFPLQKDYADIIVQKQAVKNDSEQSDKELPVFPAFPPFSFFHAGTTYQNIKFNKDEKNGYMVFDYCPLKKDYADTIVQKQAVKNDTECIKTQLTKKNDELQKKVFELTENINESKNKEAVVKEQLAKLLDDTESIKTQLTKKNDELQEKVFELTENINESKNKEAVVKEQLAKLLDDTESIKTQLTKKNDELQEKVFELTENINESKNKEAVVKEQLAKLLDDTEGIKTQLTKKNDELQKKVFELIENINESKNKEAVVKEQSAELLDEESKKSNTGLLVEQSNLRKNDVPATDIQPKRRTVWCRIKKSLRRIICCA